MSDTRVPIRRFSGPAALALALAAALAAPAAAQIQGDRQTLGTQGGKPYVMILFDTSGSMNWATACDAADRAAGRCAHDCPAPNCPQPRAGDDPNSKIYQAKDALYTVINGDASLGIDGVPELAVRWGFASLNQDELAVTGKHWLYEVTGISLTTGAATPAFPDVGWQEVFGASTGGSGSAAWDITCDRKDPTADDNNSALYETGCYMTTQDAIETSSTDVWSLNKLKHLPKGGAVGTDSAVYFVRDSGINPTNYYRVIYGAVPGGAVDYATTGTLTVPVTIQSCASGDVTDDASGRPVLCGALDLGWALVAERVVTYEKVGPFFFWEGSISKTTQANSLYSKDSNFGGRTDGLEVALTGVNWANTSYATKTCRGWEPSGVYPGQSTDITEIDPYNASYNLKFPTTSSTFDPPGTTDDWIFEYGDIIPLRWDDFDDTVDDNRTALLARLNPKHPLVDSESYGQAPFFADQFGLAEDFLRLEVEDDSTTAGIDEAVRPLVSMGSTPLAGWFAMFRRWYSGCGDPGNCDTDFTGWQDIAAQFDPEFNCTKKYVLMITDGEESCDGSPQAPAEEYYDSNIEEFPDGFSKTADQCRYRASLSAQEGVESIVIGFGVENKAKLQCANTPVFFADTKGELVDLLQEILDRILEEAAAFASAAVPTVQANILDKIYLSSFIPLNADPGSDASVWPGRLDSFLKPLPLDASNLPDRDATCLVGQQSECFAWDAGDSQLGWDTDGVPTYDPQGLLLQAPIAADIVRDYSASGIDSLQVGTAQDERRVFWGRPDDDSDVGHRRYFQYVDEADADANDQWLDLAFVWNIPIADATAVSAAEKDEMAEIIEFTLREKRAELDRACTAGTNIGGTCDVDTDCDSTVGAGDGLCTLDARIQYVLGDIFHSNPVVVNPPADFELFTKDLYWNTGLCGDDVDSTRARGEQISYSWFSNKNLCRRVMVAVGSNDGQLHVFDGGIIRDITPDDPTTPATDEEVKADCLLNVPTNSSSFSVDLRDDDGAEGDYDFGTGRELFSFIPQAMMPFVKQLNEIPELTVEYGIDGTTRTADVFVDPAPELGVAECEQRVWRSLMLGTYREGGPGIFALDITQPDVIESGSNQPQPLDDTPAYVPSCIDGGAGCDEFCIAGDTDCAALPFPALKWEFRDLDALGAPADDDLNGVTDLAEGWSRPLVFRHPVCTDVLAADCAPEDRWLAVFGGGLPEMPTNDATETAGNWLYMLDIETGTILYKRGGALAAATTSPIEGAVPADITGLDFDVDGIVDTLYFGTTAGYVYKVDLGDAAWELDSLTGQLADPPAAAGRYDPFKIFWTGDPGVAGTGRPIYLEIGAVYVPARGTNAILFGTGIRWDLWDDTGHEGRFYTLLDTGWKDADLDGVADAACASCPTPLDESVYTAVDPDTGAAISRLLFDGIPPDTLPGWYFPLDADEKLITEPLTLSGISVFTVFDPLIVENRNASCSLGGASKIFVVNTVTTEGYAIAAGSTVRTRYTITETFTTQPFVEPSATKNAPTSSSSANADSWTVELREINADLKRLFPPGARFANYTLDVKTIRKDTGLVFIAPVPVAIEPHNWKEF